MWFGDISHSKNIFKKNNRELLVLAEAITGETIPHHEDLPELICRACERRIGHFRTKIRESQKTFGRSSKRCVEMSPSLVRVAKAHRHLQTNPVSQMLDFTSDEEQITEEVSFSLILLC
jgi:hypothetical protein